MHLTDSLGSSSTNLTHPASINDTEIIIKSYIYIGLYIHQIIDDFTHFNLLKCHRVAPKNCGYPFSK